MTNPIHLAKVKQGADQWNRWRRETSHSPQVDLVKADLRAGVLIHANLRKVDLRYADLSRADKRLPSLSSSSREKAEQSFQVPQEATSRQSRTDAWLVGRQARFSVTVIRI